MIVRHDAVAQCRESLRYTLNNYTIGKGVSKVLEFHISTGTWDEEASFIPCDTRSNQKQRYVNIGIGN